MIKITKNKKVGSGTLCLNCENITVFSEEDDDFVANYNRTYRVYFPATYDVITLCEDCLRELKTELDKVFIEILDK